ncbi:MAG TPA: glucoamylase family protein [Acidisarcina sp.]|nr:glucoamylase family protein [Acidisarcina sp.]
MTEYAPQENLSTKSFATIDETQLRTHARDASARWHVDHRPAGRSTFPQRAEAVRQSLLSLNDSLESIDETSPLWELRGNARLLRSALWDEPRETVPKLPRVQSEAGEEPRIITIASSFLDATNSYWSWPALHIYIDELQRREPLQIGEVWNLPTALRFVLLERCLGQIGQMIASQATGSRTELLMRRLDAIREMGELDWTPLMEPLIHLDAVLHRDPSGVYPRMDFESRDAYRRRIAFVARYSESTEYEVASHVLELAEGARSSPSSKDPRMELRRTHIGYYLVDEGFQHLAARVSFHPPWAERLRILLRKHPDEFYIGGIQVATILLIALIVFPLVPDYSVFGWMTIAFLLLLLPAAQGAVDLVNSITTEFLTAEALPKLDFSEGIPEESTTLVAVPTLLLNEKQVRGLFEDMEIRFLSNPDPNLHFALLTDLPDSVTQPNENDSDPLVDLAVELVDELNRRHKGRNVGSFLLLHRHRIFNARQGVWMGWERKRGKLLDLNQYLHSDYDSFPVKAGNLEVLSQVRYVITLDSDTQLPRGSAHRMIGALAHPLNRAIIDPNLRIVTSGYGILQPRIGVSVQSAARSRLAAIYSGETGLDIYSRAVSDAYQDLYREGIFTGKGIYEVSTLHKVLDRRFPRNSLLSHDLIEGAYARAGLLSDVELIDDYPSHYSAYTRRQHRWVRGDWQIAQWLFQLVPDESGHWGRNPISTISRWKILDNLRRSLVQPFTFFLLMAGWLGLPGGPLYWTIATLFVLFVPSLLQLGFSILRMLRNPAKGATREVFADFLQAAGLAFLNLVFLPHQTLLSLDAIVRSLVRRFVTGQRLLEWETAAQAESNAKRVTPVDRYLKATVPLTIGLALLIGAVHLHALEVAAPVLLLWISESGITLWLNQPPREDDSGKLGRQSEEFARQQALLMWRYFRQFGDREHNYLIPDNVREEGMVAAPRTSPTNIGLLLNARQAACELGYITLPEFAFLTEQSLSSIGRLVRYRGHLYNWYDTRTLAILAPAVVSTVDSGNLAASLYTLDAGIRSLLHEPLLSRKLFRGLEDILKLPWLQNVFPAMPAREASTEAWLRWAISIEEEEEAGSRESGVLEQADTRWWRAEALARIRAITSLAHDYLPWMLPEFAPLRTISSMGINSYVAPPLKKTAAFAFELDAALQRNWATLDEESPNLVLGEQLRALLPEATRRLQELTESLRAISQDACRNVEEMEFGFLLNHSRKLLSIGYEVTEGRQLASCYDLLASEARTACFIAIAKGDIPQQIWFRMGRGHTIAFDRPILLSWTGTMFEYMMPALWMRSYPNTLMSRTLRANAEIQIAFGNKYRIPWGISESGYATQDTEGNYQYYAFGIPEIALKGTPAAGPVVSPYSSFLALGVARSDALHNLHWMQQAGWSGAFGLYEAADYSDSLARPVLVREWMAHHQGMSLLAVLNLLRDNVVQQWFHENPAIQATELLLQEKAMRTSIIRAAHQKLQEHAATSRLRKGA